MRNRGARACRLAAIASIGVSVAVTVGMLGAASARAPSPVQAVESGSSLFSSYCAACHGASARGDGPLADSMRRRPADLTTIGKREGGVFPADKVFRIIDGRQTVPGHGGPDMPVWGDTFKRSMLGADDARVKLRIEQLVRYLETIQGRPTSR